MQRTRKAAPLIDDVHMAVDLSRGYIPPVAFFLDLRKGVKIGNRRTSVRMQGERLFPADSVCSYSRTYPLTLKRRGFTSIFLVHRGLFPLSGYRALIPEAKRASGLTHNVVEDRPLPCLFKCLRFLKSVYPGYAGI